MSEEYLDNSKEWIEVAGLTDYITQYGSGSSLKDISLTDLYKYLQNPYSNIKEIQKASKYLTNKHGVIKEVLRSLKSLPTLDYVISWSEVDDEKKLRNYERKVNDFLRDIDVKLFVRDGLFEVGQMGTIVTCLRNKKYVQFLELDDLRINRQRNGRWIVEYDLKTIQKIKNTNEKLAVIESLPDEVSIAKYNLYANKGEDYRYVELKDADVINIDGNRNMPYGLPLTMGSWSALLQKEIIDQVERSVADRLLKTIVILSAGHLDKEGTKPVPKEVITAYFNEVSKLFKKKNGSNTFSSDDGTSGTGTIALPHFFKLDTLEVNTDLFKKELYDKIDNSIYSNLGISPAVLWGGGGNNFSSATLNSQKFFRYIHTLLEKFEVIINRYIKQILPKSVSCNFVFAKSTILNHEKYIDKYKDLYMQTGTSKFWFESLTGLPYEDVIRQAEYERKVLKTENIIYPASNAYTQSGNNSNKGGAPTVDNPTNENTIKSKSSGGNNNPKPSIS